MNDFEKDGKYYRDERGKIIPSPEDLGTTFDEMATWSNQKTQMEYDKWNEKHIQREIVKSKVKAEKLQAQFQHHWYNRLPKSMIREALHKAIPHYADVMREVIVFGKTPEKLVSYYAMGSLRVKEGNLSLHGVPYTKLKKFPSFDERENKIVGSPRQIMVMYMELFPPLTRTKSRITLD